ncbi:calcium-activated chloride channel regulator 1-like isoform X2 [Ptychodera flava]|uniref:calcium-activated chloride channel regulator 1-like isoform X2 n=2 Tax=Ptychodera flava TaxID=63121 RepID=UPI003969E68B
MLLVSACLSLALLQHVSFALLPRSPISLENNEYRGVLIAISEDVTENATLLERLKEVFTDTSDALYEATQRRAFFREVTILLPDTWSDSMTDSPAAGELFDAANIIVSNHENVGRETPYTNQFGSCGEEAEYIHLTDKFILDSRWRVDKYGDPEKVIVHEWGHLRWGLFDEYPRSQNEHFYLNEDREVEATRCSLSVVGKEYDSKGKRCNINPKSGKWPKDDCRFEPISNNFAKGSYMFASFLASVTEFCHSDVTGDPTSLHNAMAPNQQNIQCSYRSAWDVMLESEDFKNDNNPARQVTDTTPTFRVVKSAPLRIVLVLDVSGSMVVNDRIGTLNQIATKYIQATVPDGHFVGLVEFDTNAIVTSNLTELKTTQGREALADLLPATTRSATCIGCGLQSGVEVLENGGQDANGGILLLITDGQENQPPYIENVKPTLVSKGVRVDTVALSDEADSKLFNLSTETGGIPFYYTEGNSSSGLNDALTATITTRLGGSPNVPIQLYSEKGTIPNGGKVTGSAFIDATIGKDTKFFFLWSTSVVSVVVNRPNGDVIDISSSEYNRNDAKRTVSVVITGVAEPGEWLYEVTGPVQQVEISIQSVAKDNTQPVRVTTTTSNSLITETPAKTNIYVQVFRGYTPILKASVIATVERPNPYSPVDVQLRDNGAGADTLKGDGVYSGVFMDFVTATCPNCRYNIKVTAEDKDGIAEVPVDASFSRVLPVNPVYPSDQNTNQTERVGQFSRVASGGVIQAPVTIPPGDNFPPSRITDLRVVNASHDQQTITLAWTAPGNDFDRGTADEYDLRISKNFSSISSSFINGDVLTNQDINDGDIKSPKTFGVDEIFTVQVPEANEKTTYYFSVRARDAAGNEGDPSNIISASIVLFVPDNVETTAAPLEDFDMLPVIIGCSVAAAVVFFAVVVAVVVKVMCKGLKKNNKVEHSKPSLKDAWK